MEGQVKLYVNDEVLLLNQGDSVKIPHMQNINGKTLLYTKSLLYLE